MTNLNSVLRDFEKSFIGYDAVLRKMASELNKGTAYAGYSQNFPPYNICKIDDHHYIIEMAVAGFGKQDIDIILDGDTLTVKGSSTPEIGEYLFKGLASRAFTRHFNLSDQVVVNNASMVNGILKIFLERIIPENKKPRKIHIEDEATTVSHHSSKNPQLLTESDLQATEGKLK